MKILLVSINSIHFQRWTEQLKGSGHEVYWFNIRGGEYSKNLQWVKQIFGWKQKFPNLKGRIFIKQRFPALYSKLSFLIEHNTEKTFEMVLEKVKPDLVHSFVLYISCAPILNVMNKKQHLKWVYSSWGSDLYYFQNDVNYLKDIKKVLPRIDFLFTDCHRDVILANKYGFSGNVLGVFPGGGGYSIKDYEPYILPIKNRDIILVKGYQGRSGRAIQVLQALMKLQQSLVAYKVIVFGTDKEVEKFILNEKVGEKINITIYKKSEFLPHKEILKLMGKALVYIGNSNSDGMPNTLLESIIMGAFPIQSNPGGATAEVITHGENGFLINDFESKTEIGKYFEKAISNMELLEQAFNINQNKLKFQFERETIQSQVISAYNRALHNK